MIRDTLSHFARSLSVAALLSILVAAVLYATGLVHWVDRVNRLALDAYEQRARCDRAVDGDTYDLTLDSGAQLRVRLAGFDAYETRRGHYSTAATIAAGERGTRLVDAALGCGTAATFPVVLHEQDRYGRWLADVTTVDGRDLVAVLAEACVGGEWVPGQDNPPIPPEHCPILVEGR